MSTHVQRSMGLHTAISVVVGSVIGSGIFMKPASMAALTGSGWVLVAVWVVAGLLSLFGALIFAEVGAMYPQSGGLYVYLQHMYGPFVAFLYGWAAFAVINTASVAAISFVCASYANHFLHVPALPHSMEQALSFHLPGIGTIYPLKDAGIKVLAISIALVITWLNARSLKAGNRLQLISTIAKVGAIALLIFGIFFSGGGSWQHFAQPLPNAPHGMALFQGIMAALTGAFVAYDGWQNINFMGAEIKKPQRNLPMSLVLGVCTCMVVYVGVNVAYVFALPMPQLAASGLVAADALSAVLGQASGSMIAALIVLVTLGAVNGNAMSTARVSFAMGADRLFPAATGKLHPQRQTPAAALWLHFAWIALLIVSGSFDMLADMFVFVTWVFIIIACIGMARLRQLQPQAQRPYRMPGYPVLLWLFAAFAAFYVVSTVVYEVQAYRSGKLPMISSILGLLITAAGIPLYVFYNKRRKSV